MCHNARVATRSCPAAACASCMGLTCPTPRKPARRCVSAHRDIVHLARLCCLTTYSESLCAFSYSVVLNSACLQVRRPPALLRLHHHFRPGRRARDRPGCHLRHQARHEGCADLGYLRLNCCLVFRTTYSCRAAGGWSGWAFAGSCLGIGVVYYATIVSRESQRAFGLAASHWYPSRVDNPCYLHTVRARFIQYRDVTGTVVGLCN